MFKKQLMKITIMSYLPTWMELILLFTINSINSDHAIEVVRLILILDYFVNETFKMNNI